MEFLVGVMLQSLFAQINKIFFKALVILDEARSCIRKKHEQSHLSYVYRRQLLCVYMGEYFGIFHSVTVRRDNVGTAVEILHHQQL